MLVMIRYWGLWHCSSKVKKIVNSNWKFQWWYKLCYFHSGLKPSCLHAASILCCKICLSVNNMITSWNVVEESGWEVGKFEWSKLLPRCYCEIIWEKYLVNNMYFEPNEKICYSVCVAKFGGLCCHEYSRRSTWIVSNGCIWTKKVHVRKLNSAWPLVNKTSTIKKKNYFYSTMKVCTSYFWIRFEILILIKLAK